MGNWFWMGGFAVPPHLNWGESQSQWFQPSILSQTCFQKDLCICFPVTDITWCDPHQSAGRGTLWQDCWRAVFPFSDAFLHPSARTLPGISRTPQNSCLALEWKFPSWHFSWECPGRQLVAHSNKTTKHLLVEHESKTLSPFSRSWDCSLFVKGALVLRKVLSHCPQDRDVWWKMKCDEYD